MSIAFKTGDYVITDLGKKIVIVYVTKKSESSFSGCMANKMPYEDVAYDFSTKDVIANLGKRPKVGSVYGTKLEPYYKTEKCRFGNMHLFTKKKPEEIELLINKINGFHKTLKKMNISLPEFNLEIRPKVSMNAGHYTFTGNNEKMDTLCIRPDPSIDLNHIFYHEFGHGIWHHLMTDDMQARWVELYHDFVVDIKKVDNFHLNNIMAEPLLTVSEYRKTLEKEERDDLKHILKMIKQRHSLDICDLDSIRRSNKSIKQYWPTKPVKTELTSFVSDYATKNSREHFCECFSSHMIGQDIPKLLKRLMGKTLKKLAGKQSILNNG